MRCIAAALLVLLVACGGDDDEPSGGAFEDAPALAAALDCSDSYAKSDPDDTLDIDVDLGDISSGSCDIDGEGVSLEVYENADYRDRAERVAESIGCSFATAFGIDQFAYAVGDNWTASPEDGGNTELADTLAETLDADSVTIDCS